MRDRLKEIKAIAKSMKLRLPFEPSNDNMHDLLDGIIAICEEDEGPESNNTLVVISNGVRTDLVLPQKPMVEIPEGEAVTAYLLNENWQTTGIPKRQPFQEQVQWAINKKATQIKVLLPDGSERKFKLTS